MIYSNNTHIYTVKHNINNLGLERKLRAYLVLLLRDLLVLKFNKRSENMLF